MLKKKKKEENNKKLEDPFTCIYRAIQQEKLELTKSQTPYTLRKYLQILIRKHLKYIRSKFTWKH